MTPGPVVGIVSAGPDRIAGNADDLASWSFDDKVLRGTPWGSAPPARNRTRRRAVSVKSKSPAATPPDPGPDYIDTDGDGIPDRR